MKTMWRIVFCAWVLWGGPGFRLVMPIDGYESKAECKAAESARWAEDRAKGKPRPPEAGSSSYQCLPTGTDPRAARP